MQQRDQSAGATAPAPIVESAFDRMFQRVAQLDALMSVILFSGSGLRNSEPESFDAMSPDIQRNVLQLAGSLASEIRELTEEQLGEFSAANAARDPMPKTGLYSALSPTGERVLLPVGEVFGKDGQRIKVKPAG